MHLRIISRSKDGKSVQAVAKRGRQSETYHLQLWADGLYHINSRRDGLIKYAYKLEDMKLIAAKRFYFAPKQSRRWSLLFAKFTIWRRLFPVILRLIAFAELRRLRMVA